MSLKISDSIFYLSKEANSCPRTPTLPEIQDPQSNIRINSRRRNLQVVTINSKAGINSPIKTSPAKRLHVSNFRGRTNLYNEFEKLSEPMSSKLPSSYAQDVFSFRSLSTSGNDKSGQYLNEISNLNNKIRNLIKEQDSLRDKLLVQENIISSLHKESWVRPVVGCHEVQSATFPQEELEDSDFQVTFRPNERWTQPKSRRFPREVFCKAPKNRLSF